MRFPVVFSRYVGTPPAGGKALGSDGTIDTPPNDGAGHPRRPQPDTDNIFSARTTSSSGWPCHRIAVSYKYEGGGTPEALNCQIWFYEGKTEAWYMIEGDKPLAPNTITMFDVAALIDSAMTNRDSTPSQGGLDVFVMVEATGTPDDGKYTFGVGADLTPLAV